MRERHVAELIEAALRRSGWVRGVRRAEAVLAWPRVVGPEVAGFATAVAFQQGTLVVEVADAETAMHLGLQRQRILEAYRKRMPETPLRDLRFRVGRVAPPAPSVPPPPSEPDPAEASALAQFGLALPDDLAPGAIAAGRALAILRARRRAAGWRPCVVCGCLAEPAAAAGMAADAAAVEPAAAARSGGGEPPATRCGTCRRQATMPKVRDAAERLLVAPGTATPALTDDERRVAYWLAEARARALIADLLPRALADPDVRGALEVAVRCAVALRRGVDLDAVAAIDDVEPARDGVDPRALRILGGNRRRDGARRRPPEVP